MSVVRYNAAYRSNGWNVGIVTDPRDGDFVQLEKP